MNDRANEVDTARRLLPSVAATLTELPYRAWHFGDSVAFEAMLAGGDALGTSAYRDFARGFVRGWAARSEEYRPLDCTAAGHAMVGLAERCGDDAILQAARGLAEYLVSRGKVAGVYATWERSPLRRPYGPRGLDAEQERLRQDPGPGVFVDCLHFDPPFFAALGRVTGERRWSDEAVEQALAYVALLQHESGLFHHFYLENSARTHVMGWGRGQGWALLGLLDVIESAPQHPGAPQLHRAARALIAAMVSAQRDDGSWAAVVGVPDSGPESSTAAFLAVGLSRAARLGVVDDREVSAAASAALRATERAIDEHGVLQGVSAEVFACTLDEHYWHVPRGFVVPWGQGPAVLALADAALFDHRNEPAAAGVPA